MTATFAVYLAPADAANVAINSADKRTAPLVEIAGRITVDGVTAEDAMRIADAWHDVHHELARRERVVMVGMKSKAIATEICRCGEDITDVGDYWVDSTYFAFPGVATPSFAAMCEDGGKHAPAEVQP